MKTSFFALLLLSFSLTAHAHTDPNAVMVEAKDIKWAAAPGMAGVHQAVVEGDASKGNHHAFTKFDAGFAAPAHSHSSNHFVTVVQGTLILTVDGHEHRLPAGSYFSFKNKGVHTTACAAGTDCIIFADVRGKWDVKLSEEKKK